MATEADDNLNEEPAATRELIDTALQAVKSQGLDINPYSVAREAGISPEALFTNSELMTLVITARGDQTTFSIDSHLVERCQELESEMAKLLEINSEIYDRALEMEERVIQLETKISDLETEAEQLTMQLQNSWHLGYKKGLADGQTQGAPAQEKAGETAAAKAEEAAPQKSVIDIELPKEAAAAVEPQGFVAKSIIDIELPESEKPKAKSIIDIELPASEKEPIKSLLDIELPEAEKVAAKSLLDIELPEAQKHGDSASLLDIELPMAQKQASTLSLLDIELPETQKLSRTSMAAIQAPETQKESIKSFLDIELPEAEKVQSIKSLLDIELPESEKSQSIKSLLDIELPESEKSQSIKSLIDIELPKEAAQADKASTDKVSADKVSADKVSADKVAAAEATPPAVPAQEAAAGSYNDRVFNAVSGGPPSGNLAESYGGMSWREVETIYQFSASGGSGNPGANPNMVFEPMAPGQAAGASTTGGGAASTAGSSTSGINPGSGNSETTSALDDNNNGGFNRRDTQPIPARDETQPILTQKPAPEEAAPPILKADAPTPKPAAGQAPAKPNPRSTFTNLTGRPISTEPDPPMELSMNQFLGDTSSYLNLDRVTMAPAPEVSAPKGAPAAEQKAAPVAEQKAAPAAEQKAAPAAEQKAAPAAEQKAAPAAEQKAVVEEAPPVRSSQEETQTIAGATQALAAEAKARAEANAQAAAIGIPPTSPSDAKFVKRDANATYDGLAAMGADSTSDVLDLEKLDIFEGLEDIDELSQIEVIEDVILPDAPAPNKAESARARYNSSDHVPVVSSDDLHDLIKSRIKKAEEPHEHGRIDAFVGPGSVDKPAAPASPVSGSGVGTGSTSSGTHTDSAGSGNTAAAANAAGAPGSAPVDPNAPPAIPTAKELEALRQGARNKFVGGKAAAGSPVGGGTVAGTESAVGASGSHPPLPNISVRAVPPEIRKACMILGVRPEDLTLKEVNEKWKAQLSAPGVHPDQGGDTESAIYLNTAKDTLVKWINDQNSKLGKKFKPKDDKDK